MLLLFVYAGVLGLQEHEMRSNPCIIGAKYFLTLT